ncbi:hypothetical protein [Streptomyces sp. NPDC055055]
MTDIARRRRHRLRLLSLGLVVTVAALVALELLGYMDKDRAGLAVAVLGTVAAWTSWEATGRASDTAEAARGTADAIARIEHARWLYERTPQFDFTLVPVGDRGAKLRIHLAGPDALGHLDSITVRIVDDDFNHVSELAGATPREQIEAHVWGPFKLHPRVSGADADGRELTSGQLTVGQGLPLVLDRTVPGTWMSMNYDAWQRTYVDHPIRIRLVCRRGDDTWTVARAIDNPPWRTAEQAAAGATPEPDLRTTAPRRLPAPRGSRAQVRRAPSRRGAAGRSRG